ncbi:hypothetical protein BHY_0460 [Borrelia nietonii YOR]|uniref:BDR-repeat family protein n=1 Tax=Borrelia nietonii YOR TaxID=1293576 RepID=A0ABN4C805_9SPIR|nr:MULTISPECIES: hypothetical protein [Borrelia]AHH03411.1 hypothetical protein BHY_0460 [Borrelia nietonii YOR]AHH13924.1 hypothetical protein BHW_0072700 [Borrelia hermsii MTW]UPA09132.1 hypothetical protein bhYOR_000422 [Borrelia nietonii YOR]
MCKFNELEEGVLTFNEFRLENFSLNFGMIMKILKIFLAIKGTSCMVSVKDSFITCPNEKKFTY